MEDGPNETQKPPALTVGKSTLEEKLAMTSPNNNSRAIVEPQRSLTPSRPRSRSGRRRNRLRSFELPTAFDSSSNNKIFKHSNSTGTSDDLGNIATPSNSNHSFSRPDALATTGHEKQRGRRGRQRTKPPNRRSSFDPTLLSPTMMAQAMNEAYNQSYRSALEEKLAMTSPNNNNNIFDNQRIPSTSGPRSRTGRRRNRRRSMPQVTLPPSMLSSENIVDKSPEKEENDQHIPITGSSGHGRLQKSSMSIPSSCSGWSYYTEMTVHTDTQLLSNDKEDTGESGDDSSSCYYSDGGIAAYEKKMHMSLAISVDDNDFDDDDDSSNSNFNYEARDNGSLKTLESAFTLSELGSNDSVSSLSVDDGEDDKNGENENDKRIQFMFSETNPTRQRQRQQRRASFQSIGRRRRRPSDDSPIKSGDDYDEFTEEEELTLDGSIPNLPHLPNLIATEIIGFTGFNKSLSTNEYYTEEAVDEEETLVEVETDNENDVYIEEVSLNDISQKRYEILISDESFEEEIIIDDEDEEEEEITVEDDDPLYDNPPNVEAVSVDYKSDVDPNDTSDDEIPVYITDSLGHIEYKDALSATDAKSPCGENGRGDDHDDVKNKDSSPKDSDDDPATSNIGKNNFRSDYQNGDFTEGSKTPMIRNRKFRIARHAPASTDEIIQLSVDGENSDDKKDTPVCVDENSHASDNSRRNDSNEDAPSMMGEKTNSSALKSQSNKNNIESLKDVDGKTGLNTESRNIVDKIGSVQNGIKTEYGVACEADIENKDAKSTDETSDCSSGYLGDDMECAKPKSYRDVLMGS